MNFFKKIISFFSPHEANKEVVEEIKSLLKEDRVRARNSKGHYVADDPTTEENEAWVEKKK
tara:strand:- start:1626 stop:1808 length:183 start_codon:yes stop_codon:yes gene_type:complete